MKPLITLILSALLFFSACKRNPTGPQVTSNVQLSADYVTCTEVWLKIGFTDAPGGGDYRITRDGTTILTGTITGSNSVIYDTTTQANKSYTYTAYRLSSGQVKEISPSISVTTLDSTSDNFTWQAFDFGGYAGSCLLLNVTIANDTDIWAVGAVYLQDSTGHPDFQPYNAVIWDGANWSVHRVPYLYQGQDLYNPIMAVFALSSSDIWFGGNGLEHWDGFQYANEDAVNPFWTGHLMQRIWANSDNSIYIVGDAGKMVHYSGSAWEDLTGSTSFDIQDVWGTVNPSGSEQVLAVACNRFTNDGSAIVQVSGNTATMVQTTGLPSNISSVWTASGKEWYICGDGLYKSKTLDSAWQGIRDIPSIYSESIRGNGPNDIYVAGDLGLMLHYNGSTWTDLTPQVNIPNSVFYGVATKGNTVIAVGQYTSGIVGQGVGGAALIVVGKRN